MSGDAHGPSEHVTASPGHAHGPSEHVTATPGHHPVLAGEQGHFSAAEWQSFRDADKMAGAYIVVLMQGIFVIGLILYLIVLWSVL